MYKAEPEHLRSTSGVPSRKKAQKLLLQWVNLSILACQMPTILSKMTKIEIIEEPL